MAEFFTFDTVQAGLFFLLLLLVGDFLSRKTNGRLPAILFSGLLFMLISWTGILPDGLLETAGIADLSAIGTGMIIVGMGASMSVRTFLDNWRVVVLAISVYFLQLAAVLGLLGSLYDLNLALGAIPGGSMTALIIQQRATALGYDDTVVLSVLFFSTQGLIACFISGRYVRKESARLLKNRQAGAEGARITELPPARRDAFFSPSNFGNLAKAYLIVWLASRLAGLIGLNQFVLCLVLGVLSAQLGFLDKDLMRGTGSEVFFNFVLLSTVISGFAKATPAMFAQMLVPLLLALTADSLVILLLAPLIGKPLGFSRDMAISLGSNVMMGFPLNMMISNGVAESLTEDPEEREFLRGQIATRMVIAGLSTTTTVAVLMGGLLVKLMH